MQKVIKLSHSQSIFVKDNTSKAIAYVSGVGGGKTFSVVTKMVSVKTNFPKVDLLYLLPTYSMFRDILFPTLSKVTEGSGIKYKINKTTGEIYFDCGGRVILKSMDNPDTIVGMNVFATFLDELDTLQTDKAKQVWFKALARTREKVNVLNPDGTIKLDDSNRELEYINQLIIGTTPEGYRFVYQMFEKDKPDNYTLIQASARENTHNSSDYYDNLEKVYPKELIEAYIEGKFVNMATGAVYKEYNREKCDTDALYREGEELHISMDFNVNNMNGVVFVKREPLFTGNPSFKYEGADTFHSVYHLRDIRDTPEMIEVIKNRYPTSPVYCYPDASGKNTSSKGFTTSDISILKEAGFHCKYPQKNPRVMDRVQSVNFALKVGLVKVNVRQCEKVADALEQQVFNKSTELPEKTSGSSIDDINDSFGYFVHEKFPLTRKIVKSKIMKGF